MRWFGMRVIFITLLLVSQNVEGHAGFGSLRQRWAQGQRINICFLGGSPPAREAIAKIASEWTKDLSVSFDFGRPNAQNSCTSDSRLEVRVGFEESGSWSLVGTDAQKVTPGKPTINFQGLAENVPENERKTLLEEFGHVLGILHAEQDPKTNCFAELDLEYFRAGELADAKFRGKIEDEIKRRYFPPAYGADIKLNSGEFISTGIDNLSVMRLFEEPEQFKGGKNNKCYGPAVTELSVGDRQLAKLMYPPKPSEIVADAAASQMTIRFEGLLASEHFGYVLNALYDQNKIAIKKHVALNESTIQEVIAAEDLAPRGVTSDSLEQFLCRINSHICSWKSGKTIWTNVKAVRNFLDPPDQTCGDPGFPKFVFCIPNNRFEGYITIATVHYDGQLGSVEQLVVGKHRGCEDWDETCRTIVRGLNPELQRSFTKDKQLLRRSFKGELDIPSRAYRLVIKYRDHQERDQLEQAINAVVERRARQLRINSEQIAIRITYPVGNPKGQAEAAGAATGPAALAAMSYPQMTPQELDTMAVVAQAGLWDTIVDTSHCQLDGVIKRTPADVPTDGSVLPPPGDPPAHCGDPRSEQYELSKRYDHATAVAGILSGKRINSTNNGVRGILPGMKLWAWEVLNGNQFNASNNPRMYMAAQGMTPTVINISQRYDVNAEGKTSNLETILFGAPPTLRGMTNRILFVAAAGIVEPAGQKSFGAQIDRADQCFVKPACWSDPNRALISVVALDGEGKGLLKFPDGRAATNYGLAFDVAAVGTVRAPFFGGWTGDFAGSSAAAPFVAGLAAMITAKQMQNDLPFVSPLDVKNRILFTADNRPELGLRDYSRYGRINFAAALNFEDDVLLWETSARCQDDPCIRKGRITRNKKVTIKVDQGAMIDGTPSATDRSIDLKYLKRLSSEGNNQFTVIFLDEQTGTLRRMTGATVSVQYATAGPLPRILGIGNKDYPFELDGLLDYTSCSWMPGC